MRVNVGEAGTRELYKFYCTKVKTPLTYKEFRVVTTSYGKIARRKVVDEGLTLPLPFRLGNVYIKKTQMNYEHMKVDYETWKKTGKMVFHMNDHSDDFKAKILWEKSKCIVKGKLPYALTFTREWKRSLAKVMKTKNGHTRYLQVFNKKIK